MVKITEQNSNVDTSYLVQTINNDEVLEEHIVRCKSTELEKNGVLYFLLFDKNFILIKDAYEYLNIYMPNLRKSNRTQEKTLVALKLLYSYLNIFSIDLQDMTTKDSSNLLSFLFGYNQSHGDFVISLNGIRSATTVNDYLSIIRNYIKYLKIENHPLLELAGKKKITNTMFSQTDSTQSPFSIKAKEYVKQTVPKYIELNEFKTMLQIVQKENDKKLECIIRLMFESGMRSGEVLGITFEDLKIMHSDNGDIYKIILRNRLQDHTWQAAKFLMKVNMKEDYKLPSYRQKGYGYNEVIISKTLYDLLLEYIDETHSKFQEINYSRWVECTTCDSVDKHFEEEYNFYIFVNSYGKPLSKKTLDSMVKELFIKADVQLSDDGGKYDGLCHRFRHGFAMYQINHNNTPLLLLKELMRHNSVSSTAIYYNPDASTIVGIKNEMSQQLYEYIPAFSLGKENVDE